MSTDTQTDTDKKQAQKKTHRHTEFTHTHIHTQTHKAQVFYRYADWSETEYPLIRGKLYLTKPTWSNRLGPGHNSSPDRLKIEKTLINESLSGCSKMWQHLKANKNMFLNFGNSNTAPMCCVNVRFVLAKYIIKCLGGSLHLYPFTKYFPLCVLWSKLNFAYPTSVQQSWVFFYRLHMWGKL